MNQSCNNDRFTFYPCLLVSLFCLVLFFSLDTGCLYEKAPQSKYDMIPDTMIPPILGTTNFTAVTNFLSVSETEYTVP